MIDREYHIGLEAKLDSFVQDWVAPGKNRFGYTGDNAFVKLANYFDALLKTKKRDQGSRLSSIFFPPTNEAYASFKLSEWREVVIDFLEENKFVDRIQKGTPFVKCAYKSQCRFHDMSKWNDLQWKAIRKKYPFHTKKTKYSKVNEEHFVCGLYSFEGNNDHKSGKELHIVNSMQQFWVHLFMKSSHKNHPAYVSCVMLSIL